MNDGSEIAIVVCLAVLCGAMLAMFVLFLTLLAPWLKCFLSGSPVSILHILAMRLRGTPVRLVTDAHVALVHSGLQSNIRQIESTYLANRQRILSSGDLVEFVKRQAESPSPSPQP